MVVRGGLVTGLLVALPTSGVVTFLAITRGCGFADGCDRGSGLVPLVVVGVALVVALLVSIVAAVRGSGDGLVLGGIGGLVVAALGLVGLVAALEQARPEALTVAYLLVLAAGGLALALGATLRLVARYRTRHRARPDGTRPSGSCPPDRGAQDGDIR